MAQRQIKLIDRKFQLRITLSVLGMFMVAFLAIIALVGVIASVNNRTMVHAVSGLDGAIEKELGIASTLLEEKGKGAADLKARHENYSGIMKGNITILHEFASRNFAVITAIIAKY